ncbi:hypothetical protein [Pseudoroseicyclus sp. CXY001]|uniref:hypothetical protein n=1 Tax=Pseudoroseicyclus sp. CXY001 TaxID=3242492 RepID=UPI0035716F89
MRRLAPALLCLLPLAAQAQDDDTAWIAETWPAGGAILEEAAQRCDTETEGGTLVIEGGAFTEEDLDGSEGGMGPDDLVIDFNHIFCSRAASLWAGTGGAPVHFVLSSGESASWTGWNWGVVRHGPYTPNVILLQRHGIVCDSFGAAPCVTAIVAEDGVFYTPISAD